MLSKLLLNLEDPENRLLGPVLWGLKRWGMWQPKRGINCYIYYTIHLIAILFVLSQYVELWCIRSNINSAMRNLSVTMLSTLCVIKAATFIVWQKYWRSLVSYVSSTEKCQLSQEDLDANKIIHGYTKYSRKVTYFYWGLVTATVFTVILAPFVGYLSSGQSRELMANETLTEILSSWAPFDKTQGFGYWTMAVYHTLICLYGGGIVANYDSNAVVLMTFFSGQLDVLKLKCMNLFGDGEDLSHQVVMKRIGECHRHHVLLVKYSMVLNSLLSPVLFLYVIICSLMICASAVQLTTEGTTTMQQLWITEYLVALVAQLFLYCWHSTQVFYKSLHVDQGLYASAWWSQGVRVRRCVILLGGQLKRTIEFTAGPYTTLSVATFIGILKGSYSYFTFLSSREK